MDRETLQELVHSVRVMNTEHNPRLTKHGGGVSDMLVSFKHQSPNSITTTSCTFTQIHNKSQ